MKFIKEIRGHCAKCRKDRWLNAEWLCRTCAKEAQSQPTRNAVKERLTAFYRENGGVL